MILLLITFSLIFWGCSREFDTSVSAGSLSGEDRLWLNDSDDDGEPDSLQKYLIGDCEAHVLTCLEKAKKEKSALAGYWDFESGSGLSAIDQSIYGNNGTIYNADWTNGVEGSGLLFDGAGSYILAEDPEFLSFGNNSRTLSAWVKTITVSSDYMDVVSRNECGFTDCNPEHSALYALSVYGENAVFRLRSNNTNALNLRDTVTNIADDDWHHIAGVLDRRTDEMILYVDGVRFGSLSTAPLDAIDDDTSPLSIGCMYGQGWTMPRYFFEGTIDEVRIYNRALSDSEIKELWGG